VRFMCSWDTPIAAVDALAADVRDLCGVLETTGGA
jgi:hypothetical protein